MAFPAPATKTNCDASTDDPKQALLVDLATLIDKFNSLLGAAAPLDSPALLNNPTAPTQALGDSSTKLATTAFALANSAPVAFSQAGAITAVTTLTAAQSGKKFNVQAATAAYNITLPAPADGLTYEFYGINGAFAVGLTFTGTLYLPDGTTQAAGTFSQNSLSYLGNSVRVWSIGGSWYLTTLGGRQLALPAVNANQVVNLGQFASSLATSGYTKLPNGLILQWGVSTSIAQNSVVTVTLPIAFPAAGYAAIAAHNNTYSPNITDTALLCSLSATQLLIQKGYNGGGVAHDSPAYWFAIGR